MLIYFKVSNFKSILDQVCLNMLAVSADNSIKQNLSNVTVNNSSVNVNRTSVIMGANGSGKSSVIDALKFVKEIALRRKGNKKEDNYIPRNRLASKDMASTFEVCFSPVDAYIDGDPLYIYSLRVEPDGITKEKIIQVKGNDLELNEILNEEFSPIDNYEEDYNYLNVDWKKERKYFSEFQSPEVYAKTVAFFKDLVFFNSIDNDINIYFNSNMSRKTLKKIEEKDKNLWSLCWMDYHGDQKKFKKNLISLLNEFGINVIDLGAECLGTEKVHNLELDSGEDSSYVSSNDFNTSVDRLEQNFLPDDEDEDSSDVADYDPRDYVDVDVLCLDTLIYKDYSVPIPYESSGTKRLVKFAFRLARCISSYDDFTLIIDELDAGLHEALPSEIIKQFLELTSCDSQLIAITHSTALLREGLLRRDEIWFSEMKDNRTTELYSLSDLKGVKSSEDFAENYLCGKYGALPPKKEWLSNKEDSNE